MQKFDTAQLKEKMCPFKYFLNKDGSYNNNCRKELHGLIFEDVMESSNITVETFDTGCLNTGCCDIVSRYLVQSIMMSSVFSIMLSILMLYASYLCHILAKKHFSGLRKIKNGKKFEKYALVINALIFVI